MRRMSLSDIGSWASIISFPLSIVTLAMVHTVRKSIRSKALDIRVLDLFERLKRIPLKRPPTKDVVSDIQFLILDLEEFYISKWFLCDKEPKAILRRIKNELQGTRDPKSLSSEIQTLSRLIFHSSRI